MLVHYLRFEECIQFVRHRGFEALILKIAFHHLQEKRDI